MKIIDYINAHYVVGQEIFYGKWRFNKRDCQNRAFINYVHLYYEPLSIKLNHDLKLDELSNALSSSPRNLPQWFKDKIKCQKDDFIPYVEYFQEFKKSLENHIFDFSYARGMRDFLCGYFKVDDEVKFSDIADFLHDFSLYYEKVLPKNEKKLIAYYENSSQIRAMIEARLNDNCVSFVDYESSPCALIVARYSYFLDLQCGFDLDNLYDIMLSGYEGVECYAFEDGFCIGKGEFENTNLINISDKNYLPKKISFYCYDYGENRTLDVFKFSKSVVCNQPIIKWIEAGIRAFEEYNVEKIDNDYFLTKGVEKIKLDNDTRWCDINGLDAPQYNGLWEERVRNYKIASSLLQNNILQRLEKELKIVKDKHKKHIEENIIRVKNKLAIIDSLS